MYKFDELFFCEYKIQNIYPKVDRMGNIAKETYISRNCMGNIRVPLYEKDIRLLEAIYGCEESELVGKNIITVLTSTEFSTFCVALGYQGIYFPLGYSSKNTKKMSEERLCKLFDCHHVVRINAKEKKIFDYNVNEITDGPKRTLKASKQ